MLVRVQIGRSQKVFPDKTCRVEVHTQIFFSLAFKYKPKKTTQNTKDFETPLEPQKNLRKTENELKTLKAARNFLG